METVQSQQNRIRIGTKIFLIAASFALPIAVLVWFMVSSINANIEFAHKELEGTAFLRPLMAVQKGIHDFTVATQGCQAADCGAQANAAKAAVSSALARLEEENRAHGESLQFTADGLGKRGRAGIDVAKLRTQWAKIESGGGTADDLTSLMTNIRTVITHAGDTSNLMLDPDLDSFYLMDAILVGAPQMQDRLGDIYKQTLNSTVEADTILAVDAALLDECDYGRVVASSTTAMNEDPNFYGVSATLRPSVTAALEKLGVPAKSLIGLLKTRSKDSGQIRALAMAARNAELSYWNTAVTELDRLLEARIADYAGQRVRSLSVSGLAIIAASILAFVLMRSITIPLEKLVRSLGPGATLLTGCVERIAMVSQQERPDPEEASIICDELNAHADDMRKAVLELARQVRGAEAESLANSAAGSRD